MQRELCATVLVQCRTSCPAFIEAAPNEHALVVGRLSAVRELRFAGQNGTLLLSASELFHRCEAEKGESCKLWFLNTSRGFKQWFRHARVSEEKTCTVQLRFFVQCFTSTVVLSVQSTLYKSLSSLSFSLLVLNTDFNHNLL